MQMRFVRTVLFVPVFIVGCVSMGERGFVRNPYGDWVRPGTPYFGDGVTHSRDILVQTIPRGGYVSRNGEYIGMAPISVSIETTSDGYPKRWNTIRATDTPTAAWRQEEVSPQHKAPEKMLIDIRPYLSPRQGMRIGP